MITAEQKVVLLERYMLELQERIDIRYQGSHDIQNVLKGTYEVVLDDIQNVLKGTYDFVEDM